MSDTTTAADANPFQQARLLTVERAQLFGRTAETMAERFEDELSRWLSDASVTPGTVEQIRLVDLATGETDLAIMKSLYQMTHGIIASDLSLAMSVVAMLCGGLPNPPPEPRPLSRLETGVYDLVLQPLVSLAIEQYMIGATELGAHVSSPSALPESQPEPAIAIPFHVAIGGIEGDIVLGLSASQLQTYSEDLDRRIAGQLASKRDEPNIHIIQAVQPVVVELIAGFEPMQVPARQLVGLQVGDVIRTRQSITRPLIARVGDERLFNIRAAQRGQRLVAEVTAQIGSSNLGASRRAPGSNSRPLGGGTR